MGAHTGRILLRTKAKTRGQVEGQGAADRNAFAVQQPVGIPGCGLQRVAKGVTQVEERTVALLGLVTCHNIGFHLDRPMHRLQPRGRIPGSERRSIAFQPFKERRIPQKPVFHHLTIAGEEIALRQCRQQVDIGQHQ